MPSFLKGSLFRALSLFSNATSSICLAVDNLIQSAAVAKTPYFRMVCPSGLLTPASEVHRECTLKHCTAGGSHRGYHL